MPSKRVVAVGLLMFNPHHRILLQLRDNKPNIPYPNTWVIPGGRMEGTESPIEALTREIGEELEIPLPCPIYFFTRHGFHDNHTGYSQEVDYFIGFISRVDPTTFSCREGQGVHFYGKEEIPDLPCGFDAKEIILSAYSYLEKHQYSPSRLRACNPASFTDDILHKL